MIWRLSSRVLIVYIAFSLVVFIFQRQMLYLPGEFRLSRERARNEGLLHWPSFERYRGLIGRQEPADSKGTIIVFHGNAGTAHDRRFYVSALSDQGFRVILAEYPGYGGRVGRPSEEVLVEDALETMLLAYHEYGQPLFLWGESLGSGVVSSAVAKANVPLKGLVLFLPWDSLPKLAQTHYWYLPAYWLVLDKYNSIDNLRHFEGNVAVILAEKDEVIPVKHGRKLWLFKDVGHNNVAVEPELHWWEDVTEFIVQ